MNLNSRKIKLLALQAGFDLCGIAPARLLGEHLPRMEEWLGEGYNGGLSYLAHNLEKRIDPALLQEGAASVIVCAVNYRNTVWEHYGPGRRNKVASYALAPDYHVVIRQMLETVLQRLTIEYPVLRGRCFTDATPLLEKAWAVEASLGWIGRNSLLVTPQFGSMVLLGEILVDAGCDTYDQPLGVDRCGKCRKCIDSCPSNAILPTRNLDARRCIARLTVEKPSEDSADTTDKLHGWIFGCDECQIACPHNSGKPLHTNHRLSPVKDPSLCTEEFWDNITRQEFISTFGQTPLAGNNRSFTPLITKLLKPETDDH